MVFSFDCFFSNPKFAVKIFSNPTKEEIKCLTDSLSKIDGFHFEVKTNISVN
ncbi:MAG: hypothetical protein HRU07_06840 [Nitrosopumilus sp.]|nr:hypothetical protein [Nitrosopumilus sp.]NRA05855.1 hypothetical protein [Nitrosopumilus sp.]